MAASSALLEEDILELKGCVKEQTLVVGDSDMQDRGECTDVVVCNDGSSPHHDDDDEASCHRFTIRGYVSKVRQHDVRLCWPFKPNDGKAVSLPDMEVLESRWWKCPDCVKDLLEPLECQQRHYATSSSQTYTETVSVSDMDLDCNTPAELVLEPPYKESVLLLGSVDPEYGKSKDVTAQFALEESPESTQVVDDTTQLVTQEVLEVQTEPEDMKLESSQMEDGTAQLVTEEVLVVRRKPVHMELESSQMEDGTTQLVTKEALQVEAEPVDMELESSKVEDGTARLVTEEALQVQTEPVDMNLESSQMEDDTTQLVAEEAQIDPVLNVDSECTGTDLCKTLSAIEGTDVVQTEPASNENMESKCKQMQKDTKQLDAVIVEDIHTQTVSIGQNGIDTAQLDAIIVEDIHTEAVSIGQSDIVATPISHVLEGGKAFVPEDNKLDVSNVHENLDVTDVRDDNNWGAAGGHSLFGSDSSYDDPLLETLQDMEVSAGQHSSDVDGEKSDHVVSSGTVISSQELSVSSTGKESEDDGQSIAELREDVNCYSGGTRIEMQKPTLGGESEAPEPQNTVDAVISRIREEVREGTVNLEEMKETVNAEETEEEMQGREQAQGNKLGGKDSSLNKSSVTVECRVQEPANLKDNNLNRFSVTVECRVLGPPNLEDKNLDKASVTEESIVQKSVNVKDINSNKALVVEECRVQKPANPWASFSQKTANPWASFSQKMANVKDNNLDKSLVADECRVQKPANPWASLSQKTSNPWASFSQKPANPWASFSKSKNMFQEISYRLKENGPEPIAQLKNGWSTAGNTIGFSKPLSVQNTDQNLLPRFPSKEENPSRNSENFEHVNKEDDPYPIPDCSKSMFPAVNVEETQDRHQRFPTKKFFKSKSKNLSKEMEKILNSKDTDDRLDFKTSDVSSETEDMHVLPSVKRGLFSESNVRNAFLKAKFKKQPEEITEFTDDENENPLEDKDDENENPLEDKDSGNTRVTDHRTQRKPQKMKSLSAIIDKKPLCPYRNEEELPDDEEMRDTTNHELMVYEANAAFGQAWKVKKARQKKKARRLVENIKLPDEHEESLEIRSSVKKKSKLQTGDELHISKEEFRYGIKASRKTQKPGDERDFSKEDFRHGIEASKKLQKPGDELHQSNEEFQHSIKASKKMQKPGDELHLSKEKFRYGSKASRKVQKPLTEVDSFLLDDGYIKVPKKAKKKRKLSSSETIYGLIGRGQMTCLQLDKPKARKKKKGIWGQSADQFMKMNTLSTFKPSTAQVTGDTLQHLPESADIPQEHRHSEDEQVEKSPDLEDEIPMDIVELMAKNQFERSLPNINQHHSIQKSKKKKRSLKTAAADENNARKRRRRKNVPQQLGVKRKILKEHRNLSSPHEGNSLADTGEKLVSSDNLEEVSIPSHKDGNGSSSCKDQFPRLQSSDSLNPSAHCSSISLLKSSDDQRGLYDLPLPNHVTIRHSASQQIEPSGLVANNIALDSVKGKIGYDDTSSPRLKGCQNDASNDSGTKESIAFQPESMRSFNEYLSVSNTKQDAVRGLVPESSSLNHNFADAAKQGSLIPDILVRSNGDPNSMHYNVHSNSALLQQVNDNARKLIRNNCSLTAAPVLRLMGQSLTVPIACNNQNISQGENQESNRMSSLALGSAQGHTSWLSPTVCFPFVPMEKTQREILSAEKVAPMTEPTRVTSNDHGSLLSSSPNFGAFELFASGGQTRIPNSVAPMCKVDASTGQPAWREETAYDRTPFSVGNQVSSSHYNNGNLQNFFNVYPISCNPEMFKETNPANYPRLYGFASPSTHMNSHENSKFCSSFENGNTSLPFLRSSAFFPETHPVRNQPLLNPLTTVSACNKAFDVEICPLNRNPAEIIVEDDESKHTMQRNLLSRKRKREKTSSGEKQGRILTSKQHIPEVHVQRDQPIGFASFAASSNIHNIWTNGGLPADKAVTAPKVSIF